jgi:hypothetical protein
MTSVAGAPDCQVGEHPREQRIGDRYPSTDDPQAVRFGLSTPTPSATSTAGCGAFAFVVGVARRQARVAAYATLLTTDPYPPFSLS